MHSALVKQPEDSSVLSWLPYFWRKQSEPRISQGMTLQAFTPWSLSGLWCLFGGGFETLAFNRWLRNLVRLEIMRRLFPEVHIKFSALLIQEESDTQPQIWGRLIHINRVRLWLYWQEWGWFADFYLSNRKVIETFRLNACVTSLPVSWTCNSSASLTFQSLGDLSRVILS
jgi:hypothetical protein